MRADTGAMLVVRSCSHGSSAASSVAACFPWRVTMSFILSRRMDLRRDLDPRRAHASVARRSTINAGSNPALSHAHPGPGSSPAVSHQDETYRSLRSPSCSSRGAVAGVEHRGGAVPVACTTPDAAPCDRLSPVRGWQRRASGRAPPGSRPRRGGGTPPTPGPRGASRRRGCGVPPGRALT